MRLQGAMFFVRDLPRMVEFYSGTMGLKVVEETRQADWVEFEGSARFSLHAIPAELRGRADSPEPRESVPVKVSFEVDDPAAEVARLKGLGVRVLERPWAGQEIVDPEGNILAICGPQRNADQQR